VGARVRPADIAVLIERHISGRSFGIFDEPRANVLDLNLGLKHAYAGPD
jgi:K+-transporting ATPase c subunit